MKDIVRPGSTRFDVDDDGALILTIAADDLRVCPRCPNLHIRLIGAGTADQIRALAAGLLHLADHVAADEDRP
jgi:hypothetical protein